MPYPDFEATMLRRTAVELLKKDIPDSVTAMQLVALYEYASGGGEPVVRPLEVTVKTDALLSVISWLAINPDAFAVLQKIKKKYGDGVNGFTDHFVHALRE